MKHSQQKLTRSTSVSLKTVALLILLGSTTTLVMATLPPNCAASGKTVRQSLNSLVNPDGSLQTDAQRYVNGAECLQATPNLDGTGSVWDSFSSLHYAVRDIHHSSATFLPWHRLFLGAMESAMRLCTNDSSLYIPYWDAAENSQNLMLSPAFKALGGDGQGSCIPSGPFTRLFTTTPFGPHCVARQFQFSTLPSPEVMQGLVHAQSTYYSFCQGLESGLHGAVHTYVSGDMANMYSSNDPLFYIHHANMDRHWWLWQTDNPSTAATWEAYPEQAGLGLSPSSIMSVEMVKPYIGDYPSTARIDEMYSVDAWCYTYGNPTMSANAPSWSTAPSTTSAVVVRRRLMKRDPSSTSNHYGYDNYNINNNYFSYPIQSSFGSSNGWSGSPYNPITPPSYDQTDLYNIRYQTPLPSSYINKMRLNETIIRRFESVSNSYVDHVNAVGGHVSRCALIHHHPNERHEYRVMSDSEHSSYRSHLKLIVDGFRQFSGLGDNLYTLAHH